MRYTTRIALFAATLVVAHGTANAAAEHRVEGTVLDTKVTFCAAAKAAGCAGNLTLRTFMNGKSESWTVKVPLGTPITHACQPVSLRSLKGRTVVVTEISERGSWLARAITDPDSMDVAC